MASEDATDDTHTNGCWSSFEYTRRLPSMHTRSMRTIWPSFSRKRAPRQQPKTRAFSQYVYGAGSFRAGSFRRYFAGPGGPWAARHRPVGGLRAARTPTSWHHRTDHLHDLLFWRIREVRARSGACVHTDTRALTHLLLRVLPLRRAHLIPV